MSENEKLRVLVADDEESFLKVLTAVLEATNEYLVYPCESGDEAVKRSRYDVIILDHKMPGMTGLNTLQWLHEQKSDAPVIMLTAAGSENIAVEAMKLGAYDYVRKENFDRVHFPIIVRGVYERYLFKKEKERQAEAEKTLQRDFTTLQLVHQSLTSISRIAGSTIRVLTRLTDENTLLHQPTAEGQNLYASNHEKIRTEIEILESINHSLIDLSNVLANHFGSKQRAIESMSRHHEHLREKTSLPS